MSKVHVVVSIIEGVSGRIAIPIRAFSDDGDAKVFQQTVSDRRSGLLSACTIVDPDGNPLMPVRQFFAELGIRGVGAEILQMDVADSNLVLAGRPSIIVPGRN